MPRVHVLERLGHRTVQAQPPRCDEVWARRSASRTRMWERRRTARGRLGNGPDEPRPQPPRPGPRDTSSSSSPPAGDGADDGGVELAADHGRQREQLPRQASDWRCQAPSRGLDDPARDRQPFGSGAALPRARTQAAFRSPTANSGLPWVSAWISDGQVGGRRRCPSSAPTGARCRLRSRPQRNWREATPWRAAPAATWPGSRTARGRLRCRGSTRPSRAEGRRRAAAATKRRSSSEAASAACRSSRPMT